MSNERYHSVIGHFGVGSDNPRVEDDLGSVLCNCRDKETADLIALALNLRAHNAEKAERLREAFDALSVDHASRPALLDEQDGVERLRKLIEDGIASPLCEVNAEYFDRLRQRILGQTKRRAVKWPVCGAVDGLVSKPVAEESTRSSEDADNNSSVIASATRVFGSEASAREWLTKPTSALNDRRPIDVLDSYDGKREVEEVLARIEHGVYT